MTGTAGNIDLTAAGARVRLRRPSAPTLVLLVATAASFATLIAVTAGNTFFNGDEWSIVLFRRGHALDVFVRPSNQHIAIVPVIAYKVLEDLFGLSWAIPYRVVAAIGSVACGALVYVYARRRVGPWASLAPAVLILFLGSAWEDLLWSFQMGFFCSIAAGVGALLALDHRTRRADWLAAALLLVSVSSSDVGLPFVVGAAVDLVLWRDRWRRIWIAAVPGVLWGLWYLKYGRQTGNDVSLTNLVHAPLYVFDELAAACASVFGFASLDSGVDAVYGWGRPLAVLVIGGVTAFLVRRHDDRRRLWGLIAIAVCFWGLTALNSQPERTPDQSRYQYPSVVLLVLVGAELFRSARIDRRMLTAVGLAAAVAVWANIGPLKAGAEFFRDQSHVAKAAAAGMEIAHDQIDPAFSPAATLHTEWLSTMIAGAYFSATGAFGSPAYSEAQLERAPQAARDDADAVIASAEGLTLRPGALPRGGERPAEIDGAAASAAGAPGCLRLTPALGAPLDVSVPAAGVAVEVAGSGTATLTMRRYGDSFAVGLGQVSPHDPVQLALPHDRSAVRWSLHVTGANAPVSFCGLPVA